MKTFVHIWQRQRVTTWLVVMYIIDAWQKLHLKVVFIVRLFPTLKWLCSVQRLRLHVKCVSLCLLACLSEVSSGQIVILFTLTKALSLFRYSTLCLWELLDFVLKNPEYACACACARVCDSWVKTVTITFAFHPFQSRIFVDLHPFYFLRPALENMFT